MEITQYGIYWVNLDPFIGGEVAKTRPCVIISPDEMNKYLRTVIIAPLTHTIKSYPTRVNCLVAGLEGSVMLDQLKTVDKRRILSIIASLSNKEISDIKSIINEMLC